MPDTTLSERLQTALERAGIAPRKASEDSGFAHTYVREILIGKTRSPGHEKITKLAKTLGCSAHWLATGEGSPGFDRYAVEIQFLVDGNVTELLPEGYKTVDNLPPPVKNNIPLFITGGEGSMNDAATKPRIELPADISGDNIIDLIIADNRYLPAYGPGDEVFYCANDRKGGAEAAIYAGSLCVVKIDAKTAGLYRLYAGGKPGLYMLHQVSGPVLIDQAIEWAAPELGKRQRRRV